MINAGELLRTLLCPKQVACHVQASSKRAVLEAASEMLVLGQPELSAKMVFDRLRRREKWGSSTLALGVAMPHTDCPGLARMQAVLLQLAEPLVFDTIEMIPVDIVLVLLNPGRVVDATEAAEHEAEENPHLSLLRHLFSQPDYLARLREATDHEQLYHLAVQPSGA